MKNGRIQISQETEQTTAVTSHEQQVINMVCSGRWNRYRLSVFKLDGKLDMGEVMMRYAAIMKQCEEFHTVYLYRDTENPVRVVLKEAQKTFPVHDISFLNEKNSGCSQEQLEEELNISFGTYFHMVQEFMKFSVVDALQEEKQAAGTVEESFRCEDEGIALKVIYQMFGETIGMVYVSKNSIYEQMLQEKKTQPVLPLQMDHVQKKEELYEIYRKQIVDALAVVEIFDCISREGLHKFAEGNIEESMIAADGMVKSVRMLNPGEWFGVECLLRRRAGTSTFMVAGKEAKLVYIDSRILKELFRVRPECWIKVLEDENRQSKGAGKYGKR